MSVSKQQRTYVLNVAQQFLQSLKSRNPFTDGKIFKEIEAGLGASMGTGGPRGFYREMHNFAEDFLFTNFTPQKWQLILSAGLGIGDKSGFPKKTPICLSTGNIPWWHDGSGDDMLIGLATISLVAASYDLCYAKHYQGGIRPL